MSGHTPGPWQVCNGSDVFTPLGARNAAGVQAAHNDGWHIADCDMGETETGEGHATLSYAERRANARLIAAAPALLEACQNMIGAFDNAARRLKFPSEFCDEAIESARAAIRQATEGDAHGQE